MGDVTGWAGEFFEIERYEKNGKVFRIVLLEKNTVPTLPEEYRGKKVVNTVIKSFTVDFFPIKGRKGELILKRRLWQFEGIEKMLKRDTDICVPGTHLEKEFAVFFKRTGSMSSFFVFFVISFCYNNNESGWAGAVV